MVALPLHKQCALITGGGGGIGASVAHTLALRGMAVCLVDMKEEALAAE